MDFAYGLYWPFLLSTNKEICRLLISDGESVARNYPIHASCRFRCFLTNEKLSPKNFEGRNSAFFLPKNFTFLFVANSVIPEPMKRHRRILIFLIIFCKTCDCQLALSNTSSFRNMIYFQQAVQMFINQLFFNQCGGGLNLLTLNYCPLFYTCYVNIFTYLY